VRLSLTCRFIVAHFGKPKAFRNGGGGAAAAQLVGNPRQDAKKQRPKGNWDTTKNYGA